MVVGRETVTAFSGMHDATSRRVRRVRPSHTGTYPRFSIPNVLLFHVRMWTLWTTSLVLGNSHVLSSQSTAESRLLSGQQLWVGRERVNRNVKREERRGIGYR